MPEVRSYGYLSEQLEEEGDAPLDEDNEDLAIHLGEDNEFLGEVMDYSPLTSPYEEAPILEIESDAWYVLLSLRLRTGVHYARVIAFWTQPCNVTLDVLGSGADVLRTLALQCFPTHA